MGLSQRVESPKTKMCRSVILARPDVGEEGSEDWVVRVCRPISGLICAAGESTVRSESIENEYVWMANKGKRATKVSPASHGRQKRRLETGGSIPLSTKAERGVWGLFYLSALPRSDRRFADESDQSSLVGHEVGQQNSRVARGKAMDGHTLETQPL